MDEKNCSDSTKKCQLVLDPVIIEDDCVVSPGTRTGSTRGNFEPLSAVFKPTESWRAGERLAFETGVWNDNEELLFLRQMCKGIPVPRISLEVLGGDGFGRHRDRPPVSKASRDWVVIVGFYFLITVFVYVTLHGENFRWTCSTPCGSCDYGGNVDETCDVPTTHDATYINKTYSFPNLELNSWNFDVVLTTVLKGMQNCSDPLTITANLDIPGRASKKIVTTPNCPNVSEPCGVLVYGTSIGRHGGFYNITTQVNLPTACSWVSADTLVFKGSEPWFVSEAALRMILIVSLVFFARFLSVRLYARMAAKQSHLGTTRILLGVVPFALLSLNPFFIPTVYFRSDNQLSRFFYFMEDMPPRILIAALCTYLLSLAANTCRVRALPTLLDIAVDHVSPIGVPESEDDAPVILTAKLFRECPEKITVRDAWRAYDAMLVSLGKVCSDTLTPNQIIKQIQEGTLRNILKTDMLHNWREVVREDMARDFEDSEGISRTEFARVWAYSVNAEQVTLCPPSEWIQPISKAFTTFQFDITSALESKLARSCSFLLQLTVECGGHTRTKRIRLTSDILAQCLSRQIILPRPVFTTTESVANVYASVVAAALTILKESSEPDVVVRVTGSLPFEETLSFSAVCRSVQSVLSASMGMLLVIAAVVKFALRDWERYRRGTYTIGTKLIFAKGNRWEESVYELVFTMLFALAVLLLTMAWLHLKSVPYKHARHLHLLHHAVMGIIVIAAAAAALAYFLRPVRLMEIYLWKWGEFANLTACSLTFVLGGAVCPPKVIKLDVNTLEKNDIIDYMRCTGGVRQRTFRSLSEKQHIDKYLRGTARQPVRSNEPFADEPVASTVDIEDAEDTALHAFCLETAVHSFHASSIIYEPVLRPTVILRQHSTFAGQMEEDIIKICRDKPRWYQLCITYPVDIYIKGRAWPSVAHYMHSMCSLAHSGIVAKMVSISETPHAARETAARHTDFNKTLNKSRQLQFMTEAITAKFSQSYACRQVLLDTGCRQIWYVDDDEYWGCDDEGRGQNIIGKMLMKVRRELNETMPLDEELLDMREMLEEENTDDEEKLMMMLRMHFDSLEFTEAREALLETKNKTLVNIADRHPVWGVGEDGLGKNLYCVLLMILREEYRRALEDAVPNTLKVVRNFDWMFKTFKVAAIISSEVTRPTEEPAEPGHEAEPASDDIDLNDMGSGETKCIVLVTHEDHSPPVIIVSFRGTVVFQYGDMDMRNVETDFSCRLTEMQVGDRTVNVHTGFAELWSKFKDRVFDTLSMKLGLDDEDDDTVLVFTGHSLGGALATLAAVDVASSLYKKRKVTMYNFGSPRVGDSDFSAYYDSVVPNSYRVVCKGDPVTMLPPMFSYTHVGHSVLMNSSGEFIVDATFAERRILPYFNPLHHVRLLDSHRRGDTPSGEPGYLRGITNIANKFNLRTKEELAHKMNMGQKYSPEWRRLWSVCSSGSPMDYSDVFLAEAMQFCGEPPPIPQRVPLKEYHSDLRNDTMVAATADQHDWAVSHGFRYVKTLGDVFTLPRGDGRSWSKTELKPLYLCYNEERNDHLLCSSVQMKAFAKQHGYKKLSIEGFVFPDYDRPLEKHLETVGLDITWYPHELNHSIQIEGEERCPRAEKINLECGVDCYIVAKAAPRWSTKIWTFSGLLPVSLMGGLLTVTCGDAKLAPCVAAIISFATLGYGFLLSRGAQIYRYPRLIDLFTSIAYGSMWGVYALSSFALSKEEMWATPGLIACQLLSITLTVFVKAPYTEDIWLEDGSIPPGTANQLGFRFFVKTYAYVNMTELLIMVLVTSIPGFTDPEGDNIDSERYMALGALIAICLLQLFQHFIVYWVLSFTVTNSCSVSVCETLAWNVDEFCELFPAPPSLVVGRFVIREVHGDNNRPFFTPLWVSSSTLFVSEGPPPYPGNDHAYEHEVAALLNHPVSRTNVVVSPAEGSDGTWGAEIMFNLVLPSYEAAEEMVREVATRLGECEKTPALYFGHTMRMVRAWEGWWVRNAGMLSSSQLVDVTLRKGLPRPPLAQPGRALDFARLMARCLRQRLTTYDGIDPWKQASVHSPTHSPTGTHSAEAVTPTTASSPVRRRIAQRRVTSTGLKRQPTA
eukprot:TRINITY_DN1355_c0_g1_i1.p1 TRINITY_DN1355_c0_g1~~TRINITY_DN1355_c0_g1_i1.p1  ORF type:complete len:2113 (+),score=555.76 TRINITY_DN1355_c0_g1_i1:36-6341(+)